MNPSITFRATTTVFQSFTFRQSLRCITQIHQTRLSSKYRKVVKNDRIPHDIIQIVDSGGRLGPPTKLLEALEQIDRKAEDLYLVSTTPVPVVKIMKKQDVYEKKKELKAQARNVLKRNIQKEVQLTWSAASADLAHKMKKIREELERGYKVDLVFTTKKGQKAPTQQEMHERLDEIKNEMGDLAKEWKAREVRAATALMYFQGQGQAVGTNKPEYLE